MTQTCSTPAKDALTKRDILAYEQLLCSDMAHTHTSESGAVEAVVGCKMTPIPSVHGKISAGALSAYLTDMGSPHHSQPGLVALTQSTEVATVYTPEEIKPLSTWHTRTACSCTWTVRASPTPRLRSAVACVPSPRSRRGYDVLQRRRTDRLHADRFHGLFHVAGGPLVEPAAQNIVLTPICAHDMQTRAIVTSADREITVQLARTGRKNAFLSVDGGKAVRLSSGDRITIRRSEHVTRLLRLTGRSFSRSYKINSGRWEP